MQVKMAKAYIAIIILTLAASVVATSILFSYNADAQKTVASQVLVGGGNVTYPFFGYNPQEVKIKAGGSVVWMTDVNVPFAVASSTQFVPLPPNANSKPNQVNSDITEGSLDIYNIPLRKKCM
jgi:plastocyanin